MLKNRVGIVSVFMLFGAIACGGTPERFSPDDPSDNFLEVSPGVYRGARTDQVGGVEKLAALGVRTIINLENEQDAIDIERAAAEAAGIQFISAPMDGMETPDDAQVNFVLAVLADETQRPCYVHCKKGMDRTGAIIAAHRVFNDKWSPRDAYDEMRALGFNGILLKLKDYVEAKIGLSD